MYYIHCWLLLAKIAGSAADFMNDFPHIVNALEYNNEYYQNNAPRGHETWRPMTKKQRKYSFRKESKKQSCQNLFYYQEAIFRQLDLDVTEEINKCGKIAVPFMKRAGKYIKNKLHGQRNKRILNKGKDPLPPNAKIDHYPWIVQVRVYDTIYIYYQYAGTTLKYELPSGSKCTGSIIHREFILTAGHCFDSWYANEYEQFAIITPTHDYHDEVTQKYVDILNETELYNGSLQAGSVNIVGVLGIIETIEIHHGNISLDRDSSKVWSSEINYQPITINDAENYVEVHRGYLTKAEFEVLNTSMENNEQVPVTDSPPLEYDRNDAAIIHLPPGKAFTFTDKFVPVCLPAIPPHGYYVRDECSMRKGEEVIIAGYGRVKEEPISKTIVRAAGLASIRADTDKLQYFPWRYYSGQYIAVPLSGQDVNMEQKKKTWSNFKNWWHTIWHKVLGSEEMELVGIGSGDSGAPMMAERFNHMPRPIAFFPGLGDSERVFEMGIVVSAIDKDPFPVLATDTVFLSDWILDTILDFLLNTHQPQAFLSGNGLPMNNLQPLQSGGAGGRRKRGTGRCRAREILRKMKERNREREEGGDRRRETLPGRKKGNGKGRRREKRIGSGVREVWGKEWKEGKDWIRRGVRDGGKGVGGGDRERGVRSGEKGVEGGERREGGERIETTPNL